MQIILIMLVLATAWVQAQDTTLYKSLYAGSYLIVPTQKKWKIDRAYINGGDATSIKIKNSNFKLNYSAGDTLRTPSYIADMELLTDKSVVFYQLYIIQTNNK